MSVFVGPGSQFHGLSSEEIERRLEEMRVEERMAQRRGRRIVVRPPFLWTLCRVTRNGDGLPSSGARPWLPASVVDLIDAHVWAACVIDQRERAVAREPLAVAKRPLDALRPIASMSNWEEETDGQVFVFFWRPPPLVRSGVAATLVNWASALLTASDASSHFCHCEVGVEFRSHSIVSFGVKKAQHAATVGGRAISIRGAVRACGMTAEETSDRDLVVLALHAPREAQARGVGFARARLGETFSRAAFAKAAILPRGGNSGGWTCSRFALCFLAEVAGVKAAPSPAALPVTLFAACLVAASLTLHALRGVNPEPMVPMVWIPVMMSPVAKHMGKRALVAYAVFSSVAWFACLTLFFSPLPMALLSYVAAARVARGASRAHLYRRKTWQERVAGVSDPLNTSPNELYALLSGCDNVRKEQCDHRD